MRVMTNRRAFPKSFRTLSPEDRRFGRIGGQAGRLCYPQVFADSDEFHFRRDDAGTGVGKLG